MARGLFTVGFTEAEILAILHKAKTMLLEGKTLMTWNDSDTSATKAFPMPPADVLEECQHALRALFPETYGARRRAARSSVPDYLYK
jgi:hypothetical protein